MVFNVLSVRFDFVFFYKTRLSGLALSLSVFFVVFIGDSFNIISIRNANRIIFVVKKWSNYYNIKCKQFPKHSRKIKSNLKSVLIYVRVIIESSNFHLSLRKPIN